MTDSKKGSIFVLGASCAETTPPSVLFLGMVETVVLVSTNAVIWQEELFRRGNNDAIPKYAVYSVFCG